MEKNLKNVFNKEYSENILTDFVIKTQKTYEVLGYDFKLNQIDPPQKGSNTSRVWLNEDYVNSPISNLTVITFNSVYCNLIARVAETNLEYFNEVYSTLIEFYNICGDIHLKKYLNMTYGCLGNPNCLIYSKNIHLITVELNKIMDDILSVFKNHIIYIDCDRIFFRNFDEIKERFDNLINKINKHELPFTLDKKKFGLFISKKNYMIEEQDGIKIIGLKHFNKEGVSRGGFIDMMD